MNMLLLMKLITLQMHIFTPLAERWRWMNARLSSLQHIRLRSKRLYKSESFYWRIFAFNVAMRFTWMLCFIPAYRLSSSGEEKVATFSSDVNSYVGVLLPIAEIVRRCFWGILLLERKTIQPRSVSRFRESLFLDWEKDFLAARDLCTHWGIF